MTCLDLDELKLIRKYSTLHLNLQSSIGCEQLWDRADQLDIRRYLSVHFIHSFIHLFIHSFIQYIWVHKCHWNDCFPKNGPPWLFFSIPSSPQVPDHNHKCAHKLSTSSRDVWCTVAGVGGNKTGSASKRRGGAARDPRGSKRRSQHAARRPDCNSGSWWHLEACSRFVLIAV